MIYGAHTVAKALATATANSSIQGLRKLRRMARLWRPQVIEEKRVENSEPKPNTFSAVVRDVHFWVPTIVLIAGLILLRWVS